MQFFYSLNIPLSANLLSKLLNLYQDSSGQQFNLSKSLLFLGKGNRRAHSAIRTHLKIPVCNFASKYLGVPLFFGSTRRGHFSSLLASFSKKLSGWRSKHLSWAGRLVLIKHTLSSPPVHLAMVMLIPQSISNAIERIMRNFLWSGSEDKLKANLVS